MLSLTKRQIEYLEVMDRLLRQRRDEIGAVRAGLNGLYENRIASNKLLGSYDEAVASVTPFLGRWPKVWDIGAGIGPISIALAAEGAHVIGIERNQERAETMEWVFAEFRRLLPGIKLEARLGTFPETMNGDSIDRDLALVFSCAFGASPEKRLEFEGALSRFDSALVEFGSLFDGGRTPPEERNGEIRSTAFCTRYGFAPPLNIVSRGHPLHAVGKGACVFG